MKADYRCLVTQPGALPCSDSSSLSTCVTAPFERPFNAAILRRSEPAVYRALCVRERGERRSTQVDADLAGGFRQNHTSGLYGSWSALSRIHTNVQLADLGQVALPCAPRAHARFSARITALNP